MTASGAYNAKTDGNFLTRVEYFIVAASVAVTTEAATGALHSQRMALAKNILNGSASYAPKFALAAMSNPTLFADPDLASIPDGDLQFAINSVFYSFLGL